MSDGGRTDLQGSTPVESSPLIAGDSNRRSTGSFLYHNTPFERSHPASAHAPTHPPTPVGEYAPASRRIAKPASEESKPLKPISGVELRLLNVGSVARDHLASERTFLAYVRTSLGLSSAGVALMQFLFLGHATRAYAAPLGGALVVTGLLVLLIGTRRYFLVQRTLVIGYFPAASIGISLIGFILGSLMTAAFGIILAGRPK